MAIHNKSSSEKEHLTTWIYQSINHIFSPAPLNMTSTYEQTILQIKKSIENLVNSGLEEIPPDNVDMKCIKKHCKMGGQPVVTDVFR